MKLTRNMDYELVDREDLVRHVTKGRNFSLVQSLHIDSGTKIISGVSLMLLSDIRNILCITEEYL